MREASCAKRGGVGDDSFGDDPQLDVRLLRHRGQKRERAFLVHVISQHHHADGLIGHRPPRTDRHYPFGEPLLHIFFELIRDVDVKPGDTSGHDVIFEEAITHHNDLSLLAAGIDNPVSNGDGGALPVDLQDQVGHRRVVVGMLVRHDQVGGGRDGARAIAVHAGKLVGPLPSVVVDEVAEAARRRPGFRWQRRSIARHK